MRNYVTLALAALLVGCANTRPQLPEEDYATYALHWVATNQCQSLGLMDAETAALGLQQINRNLNTWDWSPEKLKTFTDQLAGWKPTTEEMAESCRKMALGYHQTHLQQQQVAQQRAAPSSSTDDIVQQIQANGEAMRRSGEAAFQQQMNSLQQNSQPGPSTENGYNHHMINTPGGIQQRHCKTLEGGNVYCF